MSDLENFLTEEERVTLANARREADNYFDEIDSLEDELEQVRQEHRKHTNNVDYWLREAVQRKEKHLAEIEAGLADLTGGVRK